MRTNRCLLSLIIMLCSSHTVFAQNAPQNIKINGKLAEWPNLQNNKSTGSFYELQNDQKNLYIALKFTDDIYIKKVIAGGFTLSIKTNGKRNVKDAYQVIIPPVEDYRTTRQFTSTPLAIDSATQAHRKEVLRKTKEIQLVGFTEIPDSIISIYNTYGIRIGAKADDKGNLNYELSIPLAQLRLTANKEIEIAFNLQFNAVDFRSNKFGNNIQGGRNRGGNGFARGGNRMSGNNDMLLLTSANDFWDKYKLQ